MNKKDFFKPVEKSKNASMLTDPKKLEKFKNKQLKKERKTKKKAEREPETPLILSEPDEKRQSGHILKKWIFTLRLPMAKHTKAIDEEQHQEQSGFQVIKGKKQLRRLWIKVTATIIGIIVICALLFVFLLPTPVMDWFSVLSAKMRSGEGFPVSFADAGTPENFAVDGSVLSLVTDTSFLVYNRQGAQLLADMHGYADPVQTGRANYYLLYDRGRTNYKILNAAELLYTGQTEKNIVTAAMSAGGRYALVTEVAQGTNMVTVYNTNHNGLYQYNAAKQYVTGVALNDAGNMLCVLSVSAENAVYKSTVQLFSLSSTEPLYKVDFTDELLYQVYFDSNSTIQFLSASRCGKLDADGQLNASYDFGGKKLVKAAYQNGETLLCLADAVHAAQNNILVLKSDLTPGIQIDFDHVVQSVAFDKNHVFVLSDRLYAYNEEAQKEFETAIDAGAIVVQAFHGQAAVLYAREIALYS